MCVGCKLNPDGDVLIMIGVSMLLERIRLRCT
jgi:hypothetical protein